VAGAQESTTRRAAPRAPRLASVPGRRARSAPDPETKAHRRTSLRVSARTASARCRHHLDFPPVSPIQHGPARRTREAVPAALRQGRTIEGNADRRPARPVRGGRARTGRRRNSRCRHGPIMAEGRTYAEREWARPASCNSVRRVDATRDDRLAIRDVVETWAKRKGLGDGRFPGCLARRRLHDGHCSSSGPKEDLIRVSRKAGPQEEHHALHRRAAITRKGDPGIAQTRMTILQRAREVDGC